MSDADRIKAIAEEIERPANYISLERIVDEIPMLDFKNPITYHLYATYNKHILSDEEKQDVWKTIEVLKRKKNEGLQDCVDYLEGNGSTPVNSIEDVIQISSSGI
jgi:hypothetical protein